MYRAAVLLIFAMLFDMMDGRVARMTRTQSAFGLQLDSLADVISFGVAPAVLVYKWVLHREPIPGLVASFMFVACAAIRLARFNVMVFSTRPRFMSNGLVPAVPENHKKAEGFLRSCRSTPDAGATGAPQLTSFYDAFRGVFDIPKGTTASRLRRAREAFRAETERLERVARSRAPEWRTP